MTKHLLKNSIDVLTGLRMELQGKVEDSAIQQLDEAISTLQALQGDEIELSLLKWKIRLLFAEVIILLPSVAESIDKLIRVVESAANH
jgi:hypothetical protein